MKESQELKFKQKSKSKHIHSCFTYFIIELGQYVKVLILKSEYICVYFCKFLCLCKCESALKISKKIEEKVKMLSAIMQTAIFGLKKCNCRVLTNSINLGILVDWRNGLCNTK